MPAVIIPDPKYGWLCVVDVDQLVGYLADGQSLQEAVDNASFDSVHGALSPEIAAHVGRIRDLNNSSDDSGYWDMEDEE